MTAYALRFGLESTLARPLTIEGDTTADLAQAVHRHARGRLGSQRVDIHLHPDMLTGQVLAHGIPVGEFTLTPVDEPVAAPVDTSAPDHIAHGYTLRDLGRLARAACAADRSMSADMTCRYDIAWSAIAEHLCAAETPPDWNELTRVGWQAIYTDVKQIRRMYGVDSTSRSGEVGSAPRFAAYWRPVHDHPEEGLLERIAVPQVLATLTGPYREAVVALAVHGDYQRAADALGIQYKALIRRLIVARQAFRELWFAPETAPPNKGTDRRIGSYAQDLSTHCGNGHEYTAENTRWDRGRSAGSARVRRCRTCERIRSTARRTGQRQEVAA